MFTVWLMPLVLLSTAGHTHPQKSPRGHGGGRGGGGSHPHPRCPDPSIVGCDGTPCTVPSERCCPNKCNTMTLISLPSLSRITEVPGNDSNGGGSDSSNSRKIGNNQYGRGRETGTMALGEGEQGDGRHSFRVRKERWADAILHSRTVRSLSNSKCTDAPYTTKWRGCSRCVCKYHQWECITKGCKACEFVDANSTNRVLEHGETYEKGCYRCECLDGELSCTHNQCNSCKYKNNVTESGVSLDFNCGRCKCYNGSWVCAESCAGSGAVPLAPPSLFTVLVGLVLCYICYMDVTPPTM